MGHRDVRVQAVKLWWPPERWVAAAHEHCSHEASKKSHLSRGKVNTRDD